jgi:hypothetical protein
MPNAYNLVVIPDAYNLVVMPLALKCITANKKRVCYLQSGGIMSKAARP